MRLVPDDLAVAAPVERCASYRILRVEADRSGAVDVRVAADLLERAGRGVGNRRHLGSVAAEDSRATRGQGGRKDDNATIVDRRDVGCEVGESVAGLGDHRQVVRPGCESRRHGF